MTRDERQEDWAKTFLGKKRGILFLCPRSGKIKTSINIFRGLTSPKILITYPDNKIKDSWEEDFIKFGYSGNITYTTFLSLKKEVGNLYDLIVIDEIHMLSLSQIEICKELFKLNKNVLGLTGTMSEETKNILNLELNLPIIAEYSLSTAIKEGVVTDYKITVLKVPLDNKRIINKKTEKARFNGLSYVIKKLDREGRDNFSLKLQRMRVIQGSIAKMEATRKLLSQFKEERVLVFCGLQKIADSLGCPVHHSNSDNEEVFQDFVSGKGNHLAVVKIGNVGKTYKPLNKVILNYSDSNSENMIQKIMRSMSQEFDNPEKLAEIYIVSSTEEVELAWLRKALSQLDKNKITWRNI